MKIGANRRQAAAQPNLYRKSSGSWLNAASYSRNAPAGSPVRANEIARWCVGELALVAGGALSPAAADRLLEEGLAVSSSPSTTCSPASATRFFTALAQPVEDVEVGHGELAVRLADSEKVGPVDALPPASGLPVALAREHGRDARLSAASAPADRRLARRRGADAQRHRRALGHAKLVGHRAHPVSGNAAPSGQPEGARARATLLLRSSRKRLEGLEPRSCRSGAFLFPGPGGCRRPTPGRSRFRRPASCRMAQLLTLTPSLPSSDLGSVHDRKDLSRRLEDQCSGKRLDARGAGVKRDPLATLHSSCRPSNKSVLPPHGRTPG